MSKRSSTACAVAVVAAGVAAVSLSAMTPADAESSWHGAPTVTTVASGLSNPRHLAFGPGGLYVPETGTGGSSCVSVNGAQVCEGESGAVALVTPRGTETVLSGLPSVSISSEQGATGVASLTFYRGRPALLFQDFGVRQDGTTPVRGPGANDFGKLLLAGGRHEGTVLADVTAFSAAHPQDPATFGGVPSEHDTIYNSDPYDIVPYLGGYAISDSAANDVLWLSPGGCLSILDRLPAVPTPYNGKTVDAQAVPTSLAVGPDGALYVGSFPGVPETPGTGRVYRLKPGEAPTVAASGLTMVTDIAFDHKGRLLALEYSVGGSVAPSDPGALVRVNLATGAVETLPVSGLMQPTGLAVGPRGAVYVANDGNSTAPGAGVVLRITGLG